MKTLINIKNATKEAAKMNKSLFAILIGVLLFALPQVTASGQVQTAKAKVHINLNGGEFVNAVAFSPDGRYALSGHGENDRTLKLWDLSIGKQVRMFQGHERGVSAATFSPDGRYALSGSHMEGKMKLWDVSSGKEVKTFEGEFSGNAAAFSPDGRYAVGGSGYADLTIWNVNQGGAFKTIPMKGARSNSARFSPDGMFILDRTSVWAVENGAKMLEFIGHDHDVMDAAFSPDGRYVVTASLDNTLKLWSAYTGRQIKSFTGHGTEVYCVAFSPDSKHIISGSHDNTLKLWYVESGKEVRTFPGHSADVISVAYSPDGLYALSGSADKTVRLWNIETGKEIVQFIGFFDGEWITITPQGYYICSKESEQNLQFWRGNYLDEIDDSYRKKFNRPDLVKAALMVGKK